MKFYNQIKFVVFSFSILFSSLSVTELFAKTTPTNTHPPKAPKNQVGIIMQNQSNVPKSWLLHTIYQDHGGTYIVIKGANQPTVKQYINVQQNASGTATITPGNSVTVKPKQ